MDTQFNLEFRVRHDPSMINNLIPKACQDSKGNVNSKLIQLEPLID